jgi:hypothetical protein
MTTKSPYFVWDYDLSENQVKTILKKGDETTQNWLVGRILESAKFADVWKYLSLSQIKQLFPKLKLKKAN